MLLLVKMVLVQVKNGDDHILSATFWYSLIIVRPANRDWACQTERCQTLSNKASLQLIGCNNMYALLVQPTEAQTTRVTNFIR